MSRDTILVVDDEEDIRELIATVLRKAGYDTLLAEDGQQALELLSKLPEPGRLCVVLADVHMPRLDGPSLARAIRRDPRLSHVRILVLSSAPDYAAGLADVTMAKPFELEDLRKAVRGLCKDN